jgi:protein-S-isoprenylcysteine O-methyltransferase Ste14
MKPRIPPAVTFLFHLLLVWVFDRYTNLGSYHFSEQKVLALVLLLIGTMVFLAAVFVFLKARTTLDPVSPGRASKLITDGIFRWSRNPIYLAMLLWLMAWTIWLGNYLTLVFAGTFIWYMTQFQIRIEEDVLERKFGEDYQRYRERTRRWI